MSDCCAIESTENKKNQNLNCPQCTEICRSVNIATVLQHLSFPLNLTLNSQLYFYCANSHCTTSYFSKPAATELNSSDTGQAFTISELRLQSELQQGWLCYCFDISKNRYQRALETGSAKAIKEFVITQTKLHCCSCVTRNPSGQCCLSDFKKMDKMYNAN